MRLLFVVSLLASLMMASCATPARPEQGRLVETTAQPLNGEYDVEFHSSWFGPLRTTMTAEALTVKAGEPASFKANTRPGIAWSLVGGVTEAIGPVLAPYIFPQGMLLTWESTMPRGDQPGEGWIGIAKIGPFGAKTRMKSPTGPVEVVFTDGRVIAVMTMHKRDEPRTAPVADYVALTDAIRERTTSRLFDPAIAASDDFKTCFDEIREGASKVRDDVEFTFMGGLVWRKHQKLPFPLAYRAPNEESKRLMSEAGGVVEPLSLKIDEKTRVATIEALAFTDAAQVDAVFAKAVAARPSGIVLDLRSCTGFDLSAFRAACWLLASPCDAGRFLDNASRERPASADEAVLRIDSADSVASAHQTLRERGHARVEVVPGGETYAGPVAVLTLGRTRSSAEVLARMLRTRPETRLFGAKTAGRPRLTFEQSLPQGYVIRIPEFEWQPSDASVKEAEIKPDVACSADAAPQKAAAWILSRNADAAKQGEEPPARRASTERGRPNRRTS